MADCVLVEGMPVCMNDNDIVVIGSASEDSSNTLDSLKSEFFLLNESEALCSDFKVNGELGSCCSDSGVMSSHCEEFTTGLKSINEGNGHNCRKKRCADRYDSSESSDSGVATLSCTDCSGSSSGTSDITDPGSPFSTSSHSESDPESSPAKMPPTQSAAWHWSDVPFLDTKRLKSIHLHDNNNDKHQLHPSEDCVRRNCYKAASQQGKITEYFKAQLKPQKKRDTKFHSNISDTSHKKLAVCLSSNIVPVAAKLSLVFQQQKSFKKDTENGVIPKNTKLPSPLPQHRKTLSSNHELSAKQVTSVFSKPKADQKCSSLHRRTDKSVDNVLSTETKALSTDRELKTGCTPNSSPPHTTTAPLLVSTNDQCSDNSSLPSPILRTPSIIRFPAQNGWKGHFLSDIHCRWSGCKESFSTTSVLLEHLQVKHVNSQSLGETFVCLWIGCKVYDKASCSRTWLERHVLSHGGNKPFRCIVDECGQRFSSQTMLERHVNQHFSQTESSSNSSGPSNKRSLESTPNKLFRRNGKKIRYRREPFSARTFDYIDSGIMEGLQHSLMETTKRQSLAQVDCTTKKSLTLHSKIIGRRTQDGVTSVLLRWFPPDVVKDEWVPQSQVSRTRQVAWNQCENLEYWTEAPLFRRRPYHNQRKQSATR